LKGEIPLKHDIFQRVLETQFEICARILLAKNEEYSTGGDRLHNFKVAAALQGLTPKAALAGMLAKHTVSINDMCWSGKEYPFEMWSEKITDHMNYLVLLKALIIESREGLSERLELVEYKDE